MPKKQVPRDTPIPSSPSTTSTSLSPHQEDRYEKTEDLVRGARTTVTKVLDKETLAELVLKRTKLAEDQEDHENHETKILRQLQSYPNFCRYHDGFVSKDRRA